MYLLSTKSRMRSDIMMNLMFVLSSILEYSHLLLIRLDVLDPALRRCVCSDLGPINLAFLLTNAFLCRVGPQIEYRRLFGATVWKCWQPTTNGPPFPPPPPEPKSISASQLQALYLLVYYHVILYPSSHRLQLSNYKNNFEKGSLGPKMY